MNNMKADTSYAAEILAAISGTPPTIPEVKINEDKTRNAANCMTAFICARLARKGEPPDAVERTTFRWSNGFVNMRNAVQDHLWTNLRPTFVEHFDSLSGDNASAYLMASWQPDEPECHVWAIPASIVNDAMQRFPVGQIKEKRTVRIIPGKHVFERCSPSPDLSSYYRSITWSELEKVKLIEAVKIDESARRRNRDADDDPLQGIEEDVIEEKTTPGFTTATVEYLSELPSHVTDGVWHAANKDRYKAVLQMPCRSLVEMLRVGYIERLSPEVAGGTHHLSILKKNDYGKGGYHDHYWFAFYDPAAGSKIKSVQLFFRLLGSEMTWRYGFSMGNYCTQYVERLLAAIENDRESVRRYLETAPADTCIHLVSGANEKHFSPDEFARFLQEQAQGTEDSFDGETSHFSAYREFKLASLPEHDDTIVDEVGSYFTWAWPLFQASVTGKWPKATTPSKGADSDTGTDEDVDEDAPVTLAELSASTALPLSFLEQLEDALLAKQQAVLVGPPGTSKTYIAKQFARYFVRQRAGRPQGRSHELYMHANWSYEDFFEGLKPTASKEGHLIFEPKKGFFLEWVEQLKEVDPSARHVLLLDEINRCDTAAVLGELLQLLEYRGTTVRLLSGRSFVFPRNLFIIGTMNSADRSIGRMDLALRRRFLWLDLYPDVKALKSWLDRPGNNPAGFSASVLSECNSMLSNRGIPREQHIGHALFMTQEAEAGDGILCGQDVPLTERHLRRIVTFSVLPYVKELFVTQFGHVDNSVMQSIESLLLSGIAGPNPATTSDEGSIA